MSCSQEEIDRENERDRHAEILEALDALRVDRRERIATAAMVGLLSGRTEEVFLSGLATASCRVADALIEELGKPRSQTCKE